MYMEKILPYPNGSSYVSGLMDLVDPENISMFSPEFERPTDGNCSSNSVTGLMDVLVDSENINIFSSEFEHPVDRNCSYVTGLLDPVDYENVSMLSPEFERPIDGNCCDVTAGLMGLMYSQNISMFDQEFDSFIDGNCTSRVFSATANMTLTCNEVCVGASERDFQFSSSTCVRPEDPPSPAHPLAKRRKPRDEFEATTRKSCMTVERASTHRRLKSSKAFTESTTQAEHVQDERKSNSVSATTDVISSHEEDSAYEIPHEVPFAMDGPVICSVPVTCSTEGPVSAIRNPKLSPFNRREAKNYRKAHREAHILAERRRRQQMKESFAVLKGMLPFSYMPTIDQSTIVAGTANLVMDLEMVLKQLEEQKNQGTRMSVSRCIINSGLITEPGSCENPDYAVYNSMSDDPWVDDENKLYGQLHDYQKSAAGEVEVKITQVIITATVYTLRKGTDQVVILLEAFQNLQLQVSQLSIWTDESHVLYRFITENMVPLNAKMIANRIHDCLITRQFHKEGL